MESRLNLPAPAKLNLFLHITGRRDDGYHELETLFQFLDYADEVRLSVRSDGVIERSQDLAEIPREQDLSIRAAELLQRHLGTSLGARIEVCKRLPLGGGIGGGSSDAASTLLGLNSLWRAGLPAQELAQLGLQLGADVPVFIHGHAALARGVGEQLLPLEPPCPWYLVLIPGEKVSTGEIFAQPALTRNTVPLKIPGFVQDIAASISSGEFWVRTRNDCQALVAGRYPGVRLALEWLAGRESLWPGRMTGTGGCVFAAFADRRAAEEALADRPAELGGFVARGLNVSPALARLTR